MSVFTGSTPTGLPRLAYFLLVVGGSNVYTDVGLGCRSSRPDLNKTNLSFHLPSKRNSDLNSVRRNQTIIADYHFLLEFRFPTFQAPENQCKNLFLWQLFCCRITVCVGNQRPVQTASLHHSASHHLHECSRHEKTCANKKSLSKAYVVRGCQSPRLNSITPFQIVHGGILFVRVQHAAEDQNFADESIPRNPTIIGADPHTDALSRSACL